MAVVGSRKCCVVVVMLVAGHSVACRQGSQRVVSRVVVWKSSTICARMVMAKEEEWKIGALQEVVRSAFSSLVGRVCEALGPRPSKGDTLALQVFHGQGHFSQSGSRKACDAFLWRVPWISGTTAKLLSVQTCIASG